MRCWVASFFFRFESTCDVCGLRGFCAVNCRYENCREVFHPQCASMAGFGMNITGTVRFFSFLLCGRGAVFVASFVGSVQRLLFA